MAKVCELCGRGPQFGHRISHAHNVTKRRWNINLRTVRARPEIPYNFAVPHAAAELFGPC